MGDFKGFPHPIWLDEGGIANIISLKRAKQFFHVQYDSDDNNGFVVTHQGNGSVPHFHESRKGLHYMDLDQQTEHALVTTVKDNKTKYAARDVVKATEVRKLQDVIGCILQQI